MRLKTYPLPSLEGNTLSATKKAMALMWSDITLTAMSWRSSLP